MADTRAVSTSPSSGYKRTAAQAELVDISKHPEQHIESGIQARVSESVSVPSGKRKKQLTPQEELQAEFRQKVNEYTKSADLAAALDVYSDMLAKGASSTAAIFNALLSIAARYNGKIDKSMLERCVAVFDDMIGKAIPPNEAAYTSIIRTCTLGGEGERGRNYLQRMLAEGIEPRLRTYAPLLQYYASQGDRTAVLGLHDEMCRRGIQPTQPEYAAVLSVHARHLDHEAIDTLLRDIMEDHVHVVEPPLLAALQDHFSGAFVSAGSGEAASWPWRCTFCTINPETGECPVTHRRLRSLQLTSDAHSTLLKQVEGLANRAPQLFAQYQDWLKDNGPFDVIIDGANVGFSNQNFEGGALMYTQIEAVAQSFHRLGLKVLIVLSKRWLDQSRFTSSRARKPITKRQRKKLISGFKEYTIAQEASAPVTATTAEVTTTVVCADASELLKDSDVASTRSRSYGERIPFTLSDVVTEHTDEKAADDAGAAYTEFVDEDDEESESESEGSPSSALDEDAFSSDTSYVKTAPLPSYVAACDAEEDTERAPFIISRWMSENIAYKTLPGTNDDWFWLYAALTQPDQHKVIVISNDLMRDHHFQMLAPKAFTRWRERHQVNFRFVFDHEKEGFRPVFQFPKSHSHRMQPGLDGATWHFPLEGSDTSWLVAWQPSIVPGAPDGISPAACLGSNGPSDGILK